jgi:hypothetical protein
VAEIVNEPRYIVTEIQGYNEASVGGGRAAPGLSCHIIDTAWNDALIATYRTERYGRAPYSSAQRYGWVRDDAREHAERLNAA